MGEGGLESRHEKVNREEARASKREREKGEQKRGSEDQREGERKRERERERARASERLKPRMGHSSGASKTQSEKGMAWNFFSHPSRFWGSRCLGW